MFDVVCSGTNLGVMGLRMGMRSLPGRKTPVIAMGPSSIIRLTRMWPAAFLIVHPIPFWGSLTKVTLFTPLMRNRNLITA